MSNEDNIAAAVAAVRTTSLDIETAKLAEVRADLFQWRTLAYNASQARNAASFGRCNREVERLERIETALANRIARLS